MKANDLRARAHCFYVISRPNCTNIALDAPVAARGIDKHLPLRRVEFHILLSLTAGERHGYGIIQDIEARGETSVPDVGTMYRALARMQESGLIEAARRKAAADTADE